MMARGAHSGAMSTIKSSCDVQRVFSESRRVAHPLIVALIAKTPEGRGRSGRVAFVAGKKLGNAVSRNRAKRVMREAVRRARVTWPDHDVILIAREGTGDASADALDDAVTQILQRAGLAQ